MNRTARLGGLELLGRDDGSLMLLPLSRNWPLGGSSEQIGGSASSHTAVSSSELRCPVSTSQVTRGICRPFPLRDVLSDAIWPLSFLKVARADCASTRRCARRTVAATALSVARAVGCLAGAGRLPNYRGRFSRSLPSRSSSAVRGLLARQHRTSQLNPVSGAQLDVVRIRFRTPRAGRNIANQLGVAVVDSKRAPLARWPTDIGARVRVA